ncbi:hypothetical protein HSTV2_26 [Halorubrum sodomense tailed virus 2]|uniref:Uncharacterized protein n=1 Tax=Halorubrum sodomense tailed virus 2 TaxID=1262527 RepID=L7TJZ5_9CAUD|nr:hypothetical protein HSTV2_26 [Halorubrum sodomense tailed virus 2]AGC34295.1 hypothetical protein HSTV2_26 [Halorubrum sodomense tailed virus 2]
MTCTNPQWTVRFPMVDGARGPFEIKPRELTLRMERNSYDYARAEFPVEVGEAMKPHTREDDGKLRYSQYVHICVDGVPVHSLYFRPDFVTYGEHGTFIEFHDLQESMDSGIVDKHWSSVTLEEAYTYIFEKRKSDLITDIKFTVPDENLVGQARVDTLVGEQALEGRDERFFGTGLTMDDLEGFGGGALGRAGGQLNRYINPFEKGKIDRDNTKELMDGYYAIDFEQISPATAIWKLNEMFNVQTWVDIDRTLHVGVPEAESIRHVAAPDDSRAWRYNSDGVNIKHPRDPIYAVLVEGEWVDEPGVGTLDDIVSWFNQSDEDGFGDVRAEGVAFIPGVDPEMGQTLKVKDTNAKRDSLGAVARLALYEQMKNQHSGSVQINPALSGGRFGRPESLRVGDALHIVPDDQWFDNPGAESGELGDRPDNFNDFCGGFIHNEVYLVHGVTHSVTGSEWTMTAHVGMFPDFEAQSFVRYFDPRSGEYVSEEDVFGSDIDFLPAWMSIEDF